LFIGDPRFVCIDADGLAFLATTATSAITLLPFVGVPVLARAWCISVARAGGEGLGSGLRTEAVVN